MHSPSFGAGITHQKTLLREILLDLSNCVLTAVELLTISTAINHQPDSTNIPFQRRVRRQ